MSEKAAVHVAFDLTLQREGAMAIYRGWIQPQLPDRPHGPHVVFHFAAVRHADDRLQFMIAEMPPTYAVWIKTVPPKHQSKVKLLLMQMMTVAIGHFERGFKMPWRQMHARVVATGESVSGKSTEPIPMRPRCPKTREYMIAIARCRPAHPGWDSMGVYEGPDGTKIIYSTNVALS
jgi:hypothetical protein